MKSIREIAEQIVLNHTRRDSKAFVSAIERALRDRDERAAKIAESWENEKKVNPARAIAAAIRQGHDLPINEHDPYCQICPR